MSCSLSIAFVALEFVKLDIIMILLLYAFRWTLFEIIINQTKYAVIAYIARIAGQLDHKTMVMCAFVRSTQHKSTEKRSGS